MSFAVSLSRAAQDIILLLRLIDSPWGGRRRSAYRVISVRARWSTRRQKKRAIRLAALVCISLAASRPAYAQSDEVVTPVELFDPDAGEGVRISPGFILFPQATVDLTYDTNIFNLDELAEEDTLLSFRPTAVIASDFSRHAVRLEAGAEIRRYFDFSTENSEQFRTNLTTLLELGSDIDFELGGGYSRGIEQRGSAGDAFFTDTPVVFHDKRAGFELSRAGNRLELGIAGSILKRDHSDTSINGVPFDLSFRDVDILNGVVRADLRLSDRTEIFAEFGVRELNFDILSDPNRDTDGFYTLVGISYELSSLVELEVGAGYIEQSFEDPLVETAQEVNFRLEASWTPRPEWRFTARAARDVDPGRVLEAPAIIASSFRLTAERAVSDRLLLSADTLYLEEDFRGLPRTDRRFAISGSATYRLAGRIGLIVSAGFRDQDGGEFGRSFDGAFVSAGVRAAW
ncbi:outer membrane beta-barrel protein [Erythrobacter rubeus]|uniref:Outer membrane beta-barrel protein n=1 Tax=Erythrobacter rubeus TaxID=2760803 RepID=A0ABR8KPC6_9SPHN|nr:outer membrane beta-barrel protein [Erythrobacter rubeus]MBD2841018.1 outer membrane beta-barrel protein [Erythrobacter rubeus]